MLATTGVESLHDYISRYLPQLVLSVVVPLIMLGYLFTADLTSALIVACTLPLIPLFMALVGWYTDRQTRAKWASLSRLAGHFTDVVAGLPTLKVFGRAKAQAQAVRSVTDDYRKSSMVTLRVAFLSSMVLELLASLSVALVAVAIGLRLVYGDLTLQVGLAVLILAPEAYLPLRQLGTQFHAAADGVAATAKVLAILDTSPPAPGTRTDLPAVPGLRVDGATVGTAGQRGSVGPLSLDIPAGRITVITGDSGVGKTTLLQMLAGVQRPDGGQVLVVDDPVSRIGGRGSVGPGSVDAEPTDATGRPRRVSTWPRWNHTGGENSSPGPAREQPCRPGPFATTSRWATPASTTRPCARRSKRSTPRRSSTTCRTAGTRSSARRARGSARDSGSGSRWPGRWPDRRRWCCWTSRPPHSTSRPSNGCSPASRAPSADARSCWSPTGRVRSRWPTR